MSDETTNLVPMDPQVELEMERLVSLSKEDVPRLPEHLFVTHLLPALTDVSGKVDLGIWLDLAGTAHRPIDVIDTSGNILFRVPPLLRSIPTTTADSPRSSMYQILHTAELKLAQHPVVGATYLKHSLESKNFNQKIDYDNIVAWNNILIRYGLKPYDLPSSIQGDLSSTPLKSILSDEDDEL